MSLEQRHESYPMGSYSRTTLVELGVPTTSNIGMLLASFSLSALAENNTNGGLVQTGCDGSRSEDQKGLLRPTC
jgi:hypothetical protein